MVQSSSGKKKGLRSFTLVHASQVDGCPTKFSKETRYIKRRPDGAARVAFNQLCNTKRIHGKCTMLISVQETTQNSKHKVYHYRVSRVKAAKPGPWGNLYDAKTKSIKSVKSGKKTCRKSRGRAFKSRASKKRSYLRNRSKLR